MLFVNQVQLILLRFLIFLINMWRVHSTLFKLNLQFVHISHTSNIIHDAPTNVEKTPCVVSGVFLSK